MSSIFRRTCLALGAVLLLAPLQGARADVLVVPDGYATIQGAVQAAGPGDEVLVRKGVYHERVLVQGKHDLVLRAQGKVHLDGLHASATGIELKNCSEVRVQGFRIVRSSGDGVVLDGGSLLALVDCRLEQVGGDGVVVRDAAGVLVEGCRLRDIGGTGLRASAAPGLVLSRNLLVGAGGAGLLVGQVGAPADQAEVTENRVKQVTLEGLVVIGSGAQVRGNLLDRSGGDGLVLPDVPASVGSLVADNRILRAEGRGLVLGGAAHQCLDNDVVRAGLAGVVAAGQDHVLQGLRVVRPGTDALVLREGGGGHLVTQGVLRRPARDGLVLEAGSGGHKVADLLVTGAGADGLQVGSSGNELVGNRCKGAGLSGFEVLVGGNVLHGNQAKGSGTFDLADFAGDGANLYVNNVFAVVHVF